MNNSEKPPRGGRLRLCSVLELLKEDVNLSLTKARVIVQIFCSTCGLRKDRHICSQTILDTWDVSLFEGQGSQDITSNQCWEARKSMEICEACL